MCQSVSLIHRRVTATIAREGLPHLLCAFILSNFGTSWSRFLTRNPREGPADWKGFLKEHGRGKIMTSVYRNVTHMFKDKAWYHQVNSSFLIIFAPRAHLYWQKRHIHVEDILLTINFYFLFLILNPALLPAFVVTLLHMLFVWINIYMLQLHTTAYKGT